MGFRFVFFIGKDDAGQRRWAIAGPDGHTVLACCAGPSKSRRACLQEIAVIRNEAAGMRIKEWKAAPQRKPAVDPKP